MYNGDGQKKKRVAGIIIRCWNMSYLRFGSTNRFVVGTSGSYIIGTSDMKGRDVIHSFGHDNAGLVELFAKKFTCVEDDKPNSNWNKLFKKWMLKELARALDVKLRKKPLTEEEAFEEDMKNLKAFERRMNMKRRKANKI